MNNKPLGVTVTAVSVIIYAVFVAIISGGSLVLYNLLSQNSKLELLKRVKPFGTGNPDQFITEVLPILFFVFFVSLLLLISGIGMLKLRNWARRIVLIFCIFAGGPSIPSLFTRPNISALFHGVGGAAIFIYLMRRNIRNLFQ